MTTEQSNQLEALYNAAIVNKTINLNADVLLWTNTVSSSGMGSATIALDLSPYQAILIKLSGQPYFLLLRVDVNDTSCPYPNQTAVGNVRSFTNTTATGLSASHCYGRGFRASATGVYVTDGIIYNTNTKAFENSTAAVIPLAIYGISKSNLPS